MSERPNCQICGEPMPEGEEMFMHHGYSGPCPKPSLLRGAVIVKYLLRDMRDGTHWLDIEIDGKRYQAVGPFGSDSERQRALDDLLAMTRSTGAIDLPSGKPS